MDSLPFWIADVGVSPCSVPAVASVVLLTSTGDVFGVYRPPAGSLSGGYFELQLQTANRIEIVTDISNWCGTPTSPTSAAITMAGVGTLEVPISVGNGQGIACANALFPPGVVSPVQVVLVSG